MGQGTKGILEVKCQRLKHRSYDKQVQDMKKKIVCIKQVQAIMRNVFVRIKNGRTRRLLIEEGEFKGQ